MPKLTKRAIQNVRKDVQTDTHYKKASLLKSIFKPIISIFSLVSSICKIEKILRKLNFNAKKDDFSKMYQIKEFEMINNEKAN